MASLRLLCVLPLLLLAGCVTPPPPLFAPTADQTIPPPQVSHAQIVFLNPGGGVIALLGHVYEVRDGERELLGTTGPKTKLVVNVTPGRHLFMSNSIGFGHFLEANVDQGKRYYVLLRYVHGRGLQLRPVRNVGGDPEFSTGNPNFRQWVNESQVVTKTADTDGWHAQHKAFADDSYARGWKEWQEKRPDQRAELTLNREDSVVGF
jgi:hypothetical protein